MEDETKIGVLTTFIITSICVGILFTLACSEKVSQSVFQMGVCMEMYKDIPKCQTIVDDNFANRSDPTKPN